jgi:type I restriction enzyme S subunit
MGGWSKSTLGEICQIKPPKKEAKQKLSNTDLVSFVPMNNLGICSKNIELCENKPLSDVAGSYTYFAEEDVLLAKITPCFENGKLGIARGLTNGIGFGSSEFIVFRSNGSVDPEYLFYFLSQDHFRVSGARVMTGAVGHKRVPKEFIENHPIPLPPLPEQKRIVAILDEAFAGIDAAVANTEKNLANGRELFESYLNGVFTRKGDGWVEKRIEEWCDSVIDCVNKTAPVVEGPTPFKMIRTTNVRNGNVDVSAVRFVTEETYKIWTRRQIPQKGDVILTREAPMGEVGMLLTDDKVFLGQRLVSYRANSTKLDNEFLLFALQSGDLQGQIHAKASGSTVQHMRVPDTKNLLLAVPSLTKQRQVVAQLVRLRKETQQLETIYQQKLTALAELKQAILQKAFAGELTTLPEKDLAEAVA